LQSQAEGVQATSVLIKIRGLEAKNSDCSRMVFQIVSGLINTALGEDRKQVKARTQSSMPTIILTITTAPLEVSKLKLMTATATILEILFGREVWKIMSNEFMRFQTTGETREEWKRSKHKLLQPDPTFWLKRIMVQNQFVQRKVARSSKPIRKAAIGTAPQVKLQDKS